MSYDAATDDLLGKRFVTVEDQASGFTALCLIEVVSGKVCEIAFGHKNLDGVQHFDLSEALSSADRSEVEKLVQGGFKGEKFKEVVLKVSKNVLSSFFQTMYSRRSFWRNELSADSRA